MKRIIALTFIIASSILAQTETQIISYAVSAVVNEQSSQISGNVFVQLRIQTESSAQYSFFVPMQWNITSIRDGNNKSYDAERLSSGRTGFYQMKLERSEEESKNDSLFINIEFTASVDSSSFAEMFINKREFLLPCHDSLSWLPRFGSTITDNFSLEMTTSSQFFVAADHSCDTTLSEDMRIWKSFGTNPTSLSSAFTLCGFTNAQHYSSPQTDSLVAVTLTASSHSFNQQYADAVIRQLNEAAQFFSAVTKKPITKTSYIVAGEGRRENIILRTNNMLMLRNSPAYNIFDSVAIKRFAYNYWLVDLAQRFAPATSSSATMFENGFALYLSMRFLATSFPYLEKQERIDAISKSLTFFSSDETDIDHFLALTEVHTFRKGYIFLMLEYLLGRESFDAVLGRITDRFSDQPISDQDFQQLCEEEYGSSLRWFFEEWMQRPSAPEYIIQSKIEKTPRGVSIVKMTIEQRGDIFSMPVPVVFSFGNRTLTKRILVEQRKQEFSFVFSSPPTNVEFDPDYNVLRWLLEIRISAHARTSLQYLSVFQNIQNAEREARYTLQLDPNNSTGSSPAVFFVLGNVAAEHNELESAKEYFIRSMSADGNSETEVYKLLSLVRFANIADLDGKRDEAIALYKRAVSEGKQNPVVFERAITEAELFLQTAFNKEKDSWFDIQ